VLYRKLGHILGEANCNLRIAIIHRGRCDYLSARNSLDLALQSYREFADALGIANCIAQSAAINFDLSRYDLARNEYNSALTLYRRTGDIVGEASCIRSRGSILLEHADYAAAKDAFDDAIQLYRRVGALEGEASCLLGSGDLYRHLGNVAEACQLYEEASRLYNRVPNNGFLAYCWAGLAAIEEDSQTANSGFQKALDFCRPFECPSADAKIFEEWAAAAEKRGEVDLVVKYNNEALSIWISLDNKVRAEKCRARLARVS
jgi:tetratricopeptide (TPR) repeat protein